MYRWQYQDLADPLTPLTETVTLDKWYQPLAEPITLPIDANAYAGGSVFVAEPTDLAPAETITLDKWYVALSEPVRPLPIPQVGTFGFIVDPTLFVVPEMAFWYQPLSEPVRTVPPLRDHQREWFVAEPSDLIPVETVTLDKWYQPLSEPVLLPAAIIEGVYGFHVDPALFFVPPLDSWFVLIGNPTLPAERVHASAVGAYQGEPGDFVVIADHVIVLFTSEALTKPGFTGETLTKPGATGETLWKN